MTMSDEMVQDFEKRLKSLDIVIKLGFGLLAGAFGLGVWVSTLEWRTGDLTQHVHDHGVTVQEFKVWRAETTANRFTSQDYAKASMNIQDSLNALDKRQTRTEDSISRIEKSNERIEHALGTKP